MKVKYLAPLLSVLLLGACSSDETKNNDPDQPQDVADIDYTSDNAPAWGNYMTQVSNLLKTDAASLYDAWTMSYDGGESFADIFRNHKGGTYSSAVSCAQQIIEGCADIANEVGTAKIGDPYTLYTDGKTTEALYAVESWYSWHSREDYSNNIYSIRNSYYGTLDGSLSEKSLSAVVAAHDAALDTRVKAAIDNAAKSILAIPQPFRNHINSNESRTAMTACADLEELLSNELSAAVTSYSEAELQPVIENYVDNVVLPTYKSLRDKNAALHDAVTAFRANPSDNTFAAACDAWLAARQPWECSEAFLFGPVDALGLDPNMDSWPLDQDAIVQILNSGNFDNLNWADGDSDDKIEAVQSVRGFHTLEFLLFKEGAPRKVK